MDIGVIGFVTCFLSLFSFVFLSFDQEIGC